MELDAKVPNEDIWAISFTGWKGDTTKSFFIVKPENVHEQVARLIEIIKEWETEFINK